MTNPTTETEDVGLIVMELEMAAEHDAGPSNSALLLKAASTIQSLSERIAVQREALERIGSETWADWTVPRDIARAALTLGGNG